MSKSSKKSKSREPAIAKTVFLTGIFVELLKYIGWRDTINNNVLFIYPIFMIITSLAFASTYMDSWVDSITNFFVGMTLYFSLTYAIVLLGTLGLNNDTGAVVEGLTRISVALFTIWKLQADMRHVDLTLRPGFKKPHFLLRPFYGIILPRQEFQRLLKILIYVSLTFVLLTSGIEIINTSDVNPQFLLQTSKISNNILLVGLQSPLLMASRASISRTFSNYLDNYAELITRYQSSLDQLNTAINTYMNVRTLSYNQINSNGKHLWVTVILIFILETFKGQLVNFYNKLNLGEAFQSVRTILPIP